MSTFLVECDAATWQAYGFEHKTIEQSQAICERVFAATLDGHALVSNKSVWRKLSLDLETRTGRRNMVLIGDALHSAHFSIGSGTRLATRTRLRWPRRWRRRERCFRRHLPVTRATASRP